MFDQLEELPPQVELETRAVLRGVARTHRYLAEFKGIAATIPNQAILLNTLCLQEAKDSSAVENIITTHDEIYKAELFSNLASHSAKEVQNYIHALQVGFKLVKQNQLLTCNHICAIQETLEKNSAGFRKQAGTALKNISTGKIVYVPPQNFEAILTLMKNLERYINDDSFSDVDLLIKMAVIHYQFESIHPFYDGNGRTGRIINILYLVLKGMLDAPLLYLSKYIIETKSDYYRLLQLVHETGKWEEWILYILKGIEVTAQQAILLIQEIKKLMQIYKHDIREKFQFYSQDLISNLFLHPYTKIEFIEKSLHVTRLTATKYLGKLVDAGFLEKHTIGRSNYYINQRLYELLSNPPGF